MALHDDRKEYVKGSLDDRWLQADPFIQFEAWMNEYQATGVEDATAFALSTVSANGDPDARTVLLKEVREGELVFYTNYTSKKGKDLEATPRAHALFFWPVLSAKFACSVPCTKFQLKRAQPILPVARSEASGGLPRRSSHSPSHHEKPWKPNGRHSKTSTQIRFRAPTIGADTPSAPNASNFGRVGRADFTTVFSLRASPTKAGLHKDFNHEFIQICRGRLRPHWPAPH